MSLTRLRTQAALLCASHADVPSALGTRPLLDPRFKMPGLTAFAGGTPNDRGDARASPLFLFVQDQPPLRSRHCLLGTGRSHPRQCCRHRRHMGEDPKGAARPCARYHIAKGCVAPDCCGPFARPGMSSPGCRGPSFHRQVDRTAERDHRRRITFLRQCCRTRSP